MRAYSCTILHRNEYNLTFSVDSLALEDTQVDDNVTHTVAHAGTHQVEGQRRHETVLQP